jgi:putative hemolysin
MKRIYIAAMAALTLLGCSSPKSEEAPKRGNGYTDVETENVKMVKALNEASMKYDTVAMRGFYSSNLDTIHNNMDKVTLDQYIQLLGGLQKNNIQATVQSYPAIWETINDQPNEKGQTNFVIAYMVIRLSRGDKFVDVLFNQICAIRDGKVVEEWDVYNYKPFEDVMK